MQVSVQAVIMVQPQMDSFPDDIIFDIIIWDILEPRLKVE